MSRATPKATDTLRNLFKDEKKPQLLPQSATQGVDSDDQHLQQAESLIIFPADGNAYSVLTKQPWKPAHASSHQAEISQRPNKTEATYLNRYCFFPGSKKSNFICMLKGVFL